VTLTGDALAFIGASDGVELAAANLALDAVEVVGYGIDTGWVAYQYHPVSQLFWLQVQVETRAVLVDNEFRWGKGFLFV
jgi:hypothetical protein